MPTEFATKPTRTSTYLTELKTYTEFHWQDVQDGKYNSISHLNFIVSAEKWLISKLLARKTWKNRLHSELLLQPAHLWTSVFPKNLLKLVELFSSHQKTESQIIKTLIASRVQRKPWGPFILVRESETNDFQSNWQVKIAVNRANLAVVWKSLSFANVRHQKCLPR